MLAVTVPGSETLKDKKAEQVQREGAGEGYTVDTSLRCECTLCRDEGRCVAARTAANAERRAVIPLLIPLPRPSPLLSCSRGLSGTHSS